LNDPIDRFCGSFRLFSSDGVPIAHDQCWMALALQQRQEFNGQEILIERPDGSRVAALAHANPLYDDAGQLWGAVNVLVDITERKQAEQRKDEFLAMLAHELRNPLAPISNALQILWLVEDLEPAVEHVREIMDRQVNHLVRLVDDLVEVSRITRGKIDLRQEQVDVVSIIGNAVETSKPLIDAAGHQLAITLSAEPMPLIADPVRLAQVLSNLLNNAAKYTPAGGQIWLTARREANEVVISVRDNGLGIPAEMLPRVFDLFAQVELTRQRAQGGLGIGLTLAKRLVELHGGRIDAFSAGPSQGSEFVVRLPLAPHVPSPEPAPVRARKERPPLPQRRILVVDDTRAAAYTLGKLLEQMGQQVEVVYDPLTAWERARAERPDVVVSDIAMPEMNGYELARHLRAEPTLKESVLIALTGFGQDSDRQRGMEAGFDHYLVKPIDFQSLYHVLASLPQPTPTPDAAV
jgi:signal transduction histidine kinase/ActR/RegA family two-component response regulator